MLEQKKYDVVISFSDEQKDVAVAISIVLENLGISTYYYPHKPEENIGKDLEVQLTQIYKSSAILAIAIFSKKYFSSYYTKVELKAILNRLQSEDDYLISIRYNAIQDDIAYLTYVQWTSNPIEIAEIVRKRLEKKVNLYLEDTPIKISKLSKASLLEVITRLSKFRNVENAELNFRLALYHYYLHQSRGDLSQAKKFLQIAILNDPSFHQAYYWLSRVAIEEFGINSITYKDIQEPVDRLIKALQLAPQEPSYLEYANVLNTQFFKKHGLRQPFKN